MSKFAQVRMVNSKGHKVTGDYVTETSNAWHVGVNGKVQLLYKDEWTSAPAEEKPFDFGGLFK